MELSIFIAKIFALVYLAIGLGMLINKSYYHKVLTDMMRNSVLPYLGGVIALVIGFVLINYHNLWVGNWTVVITIIAWLALVKGVLLLVFPKVMLTIVNGMFKSKASVPVYGVLILILGLVLGYFGFIAEVPVAVEAVV